MTDVAVNSDIASRSEVPKDSLLPGLETLLDVERTRELLSARLAEALGEVELCRVCYVRYKPKTSCLVAYTLTSRDPATGKTFDTLLYGKLYTRADFINAVRKSWVHRWVELPRVKPVMPLPKQQAILYFFPNDSIMDGLRILSHPKKIRRLLRRHYCRCPEDEWRISEKELDLAVVRYKPERRVVIRCRTQATHRKTKQRIPVGAYIRIYGTDLGDSVFQRQQRLYRHFEDSQFLSIPRPLAYLPERRLLLMEEVPGKPLLGRIGSEQETAGIELAAKALAALHSFSPEGVIRRCVDTHLQDVASTARMLAEVAPALTKMTETILSILRKTKPPDNPHQECFVHGDFYYEQVLCEETGVAIIDFDRSFVGDPVADVGNFCAHLKLLNLEGRIGEHSRAASSFCRAYEEFSGRKIDKHRLEFWTTVGLFQLSVRPFRRIERDWERRTEKILKECLKIV